MINLSTIWRSRAILIWFLASVVCLVIMLPHESDSGEILGLYSLRYGLMLLVMLVFTAVAGISSVLALAGKLQLPPLYPMLLALGDDLMGWERLTRAPC